MKQLMSLFGRRDREKDADTMKVTTEPLSGWPYALPRAAAALLGSGDELVLDVAGMEFVGISREQLAGEQIGRYLQTSETFLRSAIGGAKASIAFDLLTGGDGVRLALLAGAARVHGAAAAWQPQQALDRLATRVSSAVQLRQLNLIEHDAQIERLTQQYVLTPMPVTVRYQSVEVVAYAPLELAPSGLGVLAQVLDQLRRPALVRFLLTPLKRPRPATQVLYEQVANIEYLLRLEDLPRLDHLRARAMRSLLYRMIGVFLGQACALQVQVRATDAADAQLLIDYLSDEIARPKALELQQYRERVVNHVVDGDAQLPLLLERPEADLIEAPLGAVPLPDHWLDGSGELPYHLIGYDTAAFTVLPPLPMYSDLRAISPVVVESRSMTRPEQWASGSVVVGHDGLGQPVRIDEAVMQRHAHLIGVPGSGKTSAMTQFLRGDLVERRGFVVFDPHGDLARRVTGLMGVPHSGSVSNRPFAGLRVLSAGEKGLDEVELQIGTMIEAIETMLPPEYTGPVFREHLRAILMLHAFVGVGQSVGDCVEYLGNSEAWEKVKGQYHGPAWVRKHFENAKSHGSEYRAEVNTYVGSKLRDFFGTLQSNRLFAPVGVGITADELVRQRQQLVVDFAELGLAPHDAGLVGQLFLTVFLRNITRHGPNRYAQYRLYLDEVQLFMGPAVERILQEGRKYGLCLIAAHQAATQLSRERFDALMGQVGLELVFRSSLRDSELLAEHLQIRRTSIAALPDLTCWVSGGITLQRGGNFLMKTHWDAL